jgi:hypothetical protein
MVVNLESRFNFHILLVTPKLPNLLLLNTLMYGVLLLLYQKVATNTMLFLLMITLAITRFIS